MENRRKKSIVLTDTLCFAVMGMENIAKCDIAEAAEGCEDIEKYKEVLEDGTPEEDIPLLEYIFNRLLPVDTKPGDISEIRERIKDMDRQAFACRYGKKERKWHGNIEEDVQVGLLISALLPQSIDKLANVGCGQGVLLANAVAGGVSKEYYGIGFDEEMSVVAKLRFKILERADINMAVEDILDREWLSGKRGEFDVALCSWIEEIKSDTWGYIKEVSGVVKDGGKTIAVVPRGDLFREMCAQQRQELLEGGQVETVITMPEDTSPKSGIPKALIILGNGNGKVRMINAEDICTQNRRLNTFSDDDLAVIAKMVRAEDEKNLDEDQRARIIFVDYDQIAEGFFNFDPKRYLVRKNITFNKEKKLGDSVDKIFRGVQIPARERAEMSDVTPEAEDDYYILTIAGISEGYMGENLDKVSVDLQKKYERYLIREGDLVISARGTKVSSAVISGIGEKKIIATGNLVVIRCDREKVDPYYLKAYFDSEDGGRIISSIQTGTVIIAINPKQLEEMSYEDLPLEKQRKIGEEMKSTLKEVKNCRERIQQLNNLISSLYVRRKGSL